MIRRDEIDADGTRRWLLIDQITHARLAAQLALQWHFETSWPPEVRDQFVAAVDHHDDGWAEWDSHPGVDSQGRPLNFTEMPTSLSTAIWRRSIAAGAAIGPLAVYVIAWHFRSLLLRFDGWRNADATARQAGEDFLAFSEAEMTAAAAEWLSGETERTPELAALSLQALQAFDALSLWFCCAARTAADEFIIPPGPPIAFIPRDLHSVTVSPWPFFLDELTLEVRGGSVPAVATAGADIARPEKWRPERFWWRLTPGQSTPQSQIV